MHLHPSALYWLACLLIAASCGAAAETALRAPPAAPAPTGSIGGTLPATGTGPAVVYLANVPKSGPYGLVLGLHGNHNPVTNMMEVIPRALDDAGQAEHFMVLCLKSQAEGWTSADDEPIQRAVQWACATYPIDRRRIVGWGWSDGACKYYSFGPRHQALFAGFICMSGNGLDLNDQDVPAPSAAWYILHGDHDELEPVKSSRNCAARLAAAGFPVVYREVAGEKHIIGITELSRPARAEAARWLARLRNGQVAPTDADAAMIAGWQAKMKPPKKPDNAMYNQLAQYGGPQADAVLVAMLTGGDPGEQAAAARVAALYRVGPDVVTALGALDQDKKPSVRTTAIAALGAAAHGCDPAALDLLGKLATDAKALPAARRQAVEALAPEIPLQLGYYTNPYPAVFSPLIALLDDEDASLRAGAWMTLRGIADGHQPKDDPATPPGGFGYVPAALPELRKPAVARYQAWLDAAQQRP
jgi:predicted esterase